MSTVTALWKLLLIGFVYFILGTRSATAARQSGSRLHSLPHHYGLYAGMMASLPALFALVVLAIGDDIVFNTLALDLVPDAVKAADNYKEVIVLARLLALRNRSLLRERSSLTRNIYNVSGSRLNRASACSAYVTDQRSAGIIATRS